MFYCVYLTCSNVIVGILAIMVRPEWVSRLIEFLYIVILKNAKNVRNIKYMTLIMFKLRPMKPLTSKYVKLMLTSLYLIHWLQRYANYCSRVVAILDFA